VCVCVCLCVCVFCVCVCRGKSPRSWCYVEPQCKLRQDAEKQVLWVLTTSSQALTCVCVRVWCSVKQSVSLCLAAAAAAAASCSSASVLYVTPTVLMRILYTRMHLSAHACVGHLPHRWRVRGEVLVTQGIGGEDTYQTVGRQGACTGSIRPAGRHVACTHACHGR
jgi:hypothetical protein